MRCLELLSSTESGNKRAIVTFSIPKTTIGTREYMPVVTSEDDATCASLLALLDLVDLIQALALVCSLELLSKVVVSDTAGIHNGVRRQNVLTR